MERKKASPTTTTIETTSTTTYHGNALFSETSVCADKGCADIEDGAGTGAMTGATGGALMVGGVICGADSSVFAKTSSGSFEISSNILGEVEK
jgi:hypothetical protein